jgi:hypothetical protein
VRCVVFGMGDIEYTSDSVRVDPGALLDAARRFDAVADLVDGVVRNHLDRLIFDGAHAGADHAARGDAWRRTIDDVVDQVVVWSRALRETASALIGSGRSYVDADAHGAAGLG